MEKVFVIKTIDNDGMQNMICPLTDKKSAIDNADAIWADMSDDEKNNYESFDLIETEAGMSEVIGIVYSGEEKVLKSYK